MSKQDEARLTEEETAQVSGGIACRVYEAAEAKRDAVSEIKFGNENGIIARQQNTYFGKEEKILAKANVVLGKTPLGSVDPILSPSSKQGSKTAK